MASKTYFDPIIGEQYTKEEISELDMINFYKNFWVNISYLLVWLKTFIENPKLIKYNNFKLLDPTSILMESGYDYSSFTVLISGKKTSVYGIYSFFKMIDLQLPVKMLSKKSNQKVKNYVNAFYLPLGNVARDWELMLIKNKNKELRMELSTCLYKLLLKFLEHKNLLGYCYNLNCTNKNGFINPSFKKQSFSCPGCGDHICIDCKASHPRTTCEEYKVQSKFMCDFHYATCPKCKNAVEKSEGCDHMTCICGQHFCYKCNEILSENPIGGHIINVPELGWVCRTRKL